MIGNDQCILAPGRRSAAIDCTRNLLLLAGVTIASGGVLPNINPVLLPKKSTASEEKASTPKAKKSPKKA
ncbi:putative histone H2A.2 [Capsicum chinense]|nr:putative histone H2A.2 [Capsicum chinense]